MMWMERAGLVLFLAIAGGMSPRSLCAQLQHDTVAGDYGVGIISFAFSPGPGVELPVADTLVIHQLPSSHSPVVARFVFVASGGHAWSYLLETGEDDIRSNALEFGYEVQGLPFDSVAPGGEWVQVIYGTSPRGSAGRGWVRVSAGQTQHRFWAEELKEHPLFFLDSDDGLAFYDRPAGARVPVELVRTSWGGELSFDYRLEPLEVEGRWMRVLLVAPNVPCSPARGEPTEREVWIEFLDERGRPRVWYPTRGC